MQIANGQLTGTPPSVTQKPGTAFCGVDGFTFKIKGDCYHSDLATVTINLGDPYPVAHCQDVMTGINTPVTFTLSGSDACGDTLDFNTPPSSTFDGADSFTFTVSNCGYESASQTVTINVVPPPTLAATCGPDRILLRWLIPPWVDALVTDFQIKRKVLGGSYSVIATQPADARDEDYDSAVFLKAQIPCP